jgi:hypothetical protein
MNSSEIVFDTIKKTEEVIYQININLLNYISTNNDKIDDDVLNLYNQLFILQHLKSSSSN